MKLWSPKTVRLIRRRVQRALRESPALKAEARTLQKKHRAPSWGDRVAGLFGISLIPILVAALPDRAHGGGFFFHLFLTLYATACVLGRADSLVLTGKEPEFWTLFHLPFSDDQFARRKLKGMFRGSLLQLYIFIVAYLVLAFDVGAGAFGLLGAVLLAALQWATSVSLGLALALRRPRWIKPWLGVGLYLVAALAFISACQLKPGVPAPASWFFLVLPAGWVTLALQKGVLVGHAWPLLLAVPAAAGVFFIPRLVRRFRTRFAVAEVVFPTGSIAEVLIEHAVDQAMAVEQEHSEELVEQPELEPLYRQSVRDRITSSGVNDVLSRAFLRPAPWPDTFLERRAHRWFTPREALIAEWMWFTPPRWTRRWIVGACFALAGVILMWMIPKEARHLEFFMLAPGIIGAIVIPFDWPAAPGFQTFSAGVGTMAFYAAWPLGYRDVSRVLFKAGFLRRLALAPVALLYVLSYTLRTDASVWRGLVVTVEILYILFALQPVLILLNFSGAANIAARGIERVLAWLGLIVAFLLLLVCLSAMILSMGLMCEVGWASALWFAVPAAIAFPLVAFAAHSLYGRWYDRGRVDLVLTVAAQ